MERMRADERSLVAGARRGDEAAFEALFRLHWPRAYRAAWLVVHDGAAAEDIAQESFLAALRALDRFDRRRPFGPWLHRIVVNRAIDWARARSLRGEVELAAEPAAVAAANGFDRAVVESIRLLPPDQRAVVVLRHVLGYTPGEIARLLEVPRGTVNSRLRRGLDAMREDMRHHGSTPGRDSGRLQGSSRGRESAPADSRRCAEEERA